MELKNIPTNIFVNCPKISPNDNVIKNSLELETLLFEVKIYFNAINF